MTLQLVRHLLPPAPREKLNIDIEKLLNDKIGFGGWQAFICLILFIPSFIGGLIVLNTAFTVATPGNFECRTELQRRLWGIATSTGSMIFIATIRVNDRPIYMVFV